MHGWKAVLVDGLTQSSKTWRCFDVLASKITSKDGTLVLFVTQANSTSSVQQVLQRAQNNAQLCDVIKPSNMTRSDATLIVNNDSRMLVDYWHSTNKNNMIAWVQAARWRDVIVVIDETEQGGERGVRNRLAFVSEVEAAARCRVRLIFVTATVANLSKSIAKIAAIAEIHEEQGDLHVVGVVRDVVFSTCVEHHFVEPHEGYVGPSYFSTALDAKGEPVWKRLELPKRQKDATTDQYQRSRDDAAFGEIAKLRPDQLELALIVTSVRVDDHKDTAPALLNRGFNVVVELNGTNEKNYCVHYKHRDDGSVCKWNMPYSLVETLASSGSLETYRNSERKVVKSGITSRSHVTLPHMLQAALFMGTSVENRIKANVSSEEFHKLEAIFGAISGMLPKSRHRPLGYPEDAPKVALVAGHLAGRGITIQNPAIDFVCTAFVLTDSNEKTQRGATNAQRFGRACGMLKDAFTQRPPVMLATGSIMRDALANEAALCEKARRLDTGELIAIRDLIPKSEWERVVKATQEKLKVQKMPIANKLNDKDTKTKQLINEYMKLSDGGTKPFTFTDIKNNPVCVAINATNNRGVHKSLIDRGIIVKQPDKSFVFTTSKSLYF